MSDVWGAFDQGEQIGRRLGDRRRNAQAYEQGGLDAVRESAFGRGDLDTGFGVQMRQRQQRQFEDDRVNAGFERLQQFGGFATSALRRAQSLSPEQRTAFFNQPHIRQRFESFGFTPEQYDEGVAALSNPETADEMFSELMGAFQGNIDWSAVGNQMIGVDQTTGETIEGGDLPEQPGEWRAGYGRAYRINPDGSTEYGGRIPQAPTGGAGGGSRYSILSQEEAAALGLPAGRTYQRNGLTGQVTTVGGSDPMLAGAEQRGRLVLSFPNIIQAQEDMQVLERQAETTGDDNSGRTPYARDWGARVLEAVPFDGGAAARWAGGADYQAYETASRTFEQSVMPIFSGSAVTESEAQRFVRANLPRMGDGADTLRAKAQNRARIINAAAVILGEAPPYPEAGVWTPSTGLVRPQGAPGTPGAPQSTPNGSGGADNDPLGIR